MIVQPPQLIGSPVKPTISWTLLPTDYVLPDDPVENIQQPFLAAALTEALGLSIEAVRD